MKSQPLAAGLCLLVVNVTLAGHCHPKRTSMFSTYRMMHKQHALLTHRPMQIRLTYRPRKNIPQYPYWKGKPMPDSAYRKQAQRIIRADRLAYPEHRQIIDATIKRLEQAPDREAWQYEMNHYKLLRGVFLKGVPPWKRDLESSKK